MNQRMGFIAVLISVVVTGVVFADEENKSGETTSRDVLKKMDPLIGNTYVAEIERGEKMIDTVTFERMVNDRFVRSRHDIRNERGDVLYSGETIYVFDLRDLKLMYYYFNSTGGYVVGTGELQGDSFVWLGENHGAVTQTQRIKTVISDIRTEGFRVESYFERDGAWQNVMTLHFKRTKPVDKNKSDSRP